MNATMSVDYRPNPKSRYRAKWTDRKGIEHLSDPTEWWMIARWAIPLDAKHASVLMQCPPNEGFFLHLIINNPKNRP